MEDSVDFYLNVCGLTLVFREPGIQTVLLSNGDSHHDIALMGVSAEARIGAGRAGPGAARTRDLAGPESPRLRDGHGGCPGGGLPAGRRGLPACAQDRGSPDRAQCLQVIGLRLCAGGPAAGYAILGGELGEPDIELLAAHDSRQPGLHHFGLELADDELDGAKERLAACEVPVHAEIDTPAKQSIVITDPDGVQLEFFVPGGRTAAHDTGPTPDRG